MLHYVSPVVLLLISNIFMTFAWYGHLKSLKSSALWIAIAVSWGIALFEYIFQVPANRMGAQVYTLPQLKIIQEVITMVVFAGFSYWYMGQPLKMDYLYAGLCLVGAVYFLFR
ncbi:DMT family protein [Bdellovibrio sp. HCB185ZH]|uniref:DMT family protein n=1 Tax=Bdellovibrio sp. HCB185ZH TaxID=3394235 RepID=UPI0039A516EB